MGTLEMIIGTRLLQATVGGGSVAIPVSLYLPTATGRSWACMFTIGWPGGEDSGQAMGADALQAMRLAQQMVAIRLYASELHKDGALSWGDEPGYGFPLHPNSRDLAVGGDRFI